MRILVITLVLVSLGGLGIVLSQSKVEETKDERIQVVEEFWSSAAEGRDVKSLLINSPPAYYNDAPRCKSAAIETAPKARIAVGVPTEESGLIDDHRSLRMAGRILEKKLIANKISVFQTWKREAIVEVMYHLPDKDYWHDPRYFYLYNTDDGWRIFRDVPVLTFSNEEYGKYDCKSVDEASN